MRSHDIKDRLESLLACVRMMREGNGNDVRAERGQEKSPSLWANFLQAEERRAVATLNRIIEEMLPYEGRRGRDRRIEVEADLDPAVSSFDLDVATVGPALASLVREVMDRSSEGGFVRIETRIRDDNSILLLIRNHESAIGDEEPGFMPHPAAATRLFIAISMMDRHGGTMVLASPPDEAGVIVRLGREGEPRELRPKA